MVPAGACWRCGRRFDQTTRADLAFCTALARSACDVEDPLHYAVAEVIEGWASPGQAREWLHRRAAERGED
jgi:hypothetical protein